MWEAMVAMTPSGKPAKKLSFLKTGWLMMSAISLRRPCGSSVITCTSSPASAPYSQSCEMPSKVTGLQNAAALGWPVTAGK